MNPSAEAEEPKVLGTSSEVPPLEPPPSYTESDAVAAPGTAQTDAVPGESGNTAPEEDAGVQNNAEVGQAPLAVVEVDAGDAGPAQEELTPAAPTSLRPPLLPLPEVSSAQELGGTTKDTLAARHPTVTVEEGQLSSAIKVASKEVPAPRRAPSTSQALLPSDGTRQPFPSGGDLMIGPSAPSAAEAYTALYSATRGVSMNAQFKTIPEEYAEFRSRNQVRDSYQGPVYVVEEVCVPCHHCGGPVDPVRRVPVGSLFFHEHCLQCFLCGRRSGVAGLYLQVDRQAVCSECASHGCDSLVPRREAQTRGMVYGAIKGDVYAAIDAHDRRAAQTKQRRRGASPQQRRLVQGATATTGLAAMLNKATVPGALPPSLAIASVHNPRNTGARSFALMERQQYYTQSDNNVLMSLPTAPKRSHTSARRRSGTDTTTPCHITDARPE